MKTTTKPDAASTVVTTIPATTEVAAVPLKSTAIARYSIKEADIAAIEAKANALRVAPANPGEKAVLKVLDIHDKKQVDAMIQLHKDSKKGRTTIERERTDANKSLRALVEEDITANNTVAETLQSRLNPIEEESAAEIARVEAAQQAERDAAKLAILNARKSAMAEIVGEFKDMLSPYPDDYLSNVPEAVFNPLLVTLGVQVEGRKQLAIQQAEQKAREEQAAKELKEQQKRDEAERLRLQAIEDQKRVDAQAALDADKAAFADEQKTAADERERLAKIERDALAVERQKIADERAAETARLDREQADRDRIAQEKQGELDKQLAAVAAERTRQETARLESERVVRENEQKERDRQRQLADSELYAARVIELQAVGDCGKEAVDDHSRDYMIAMTCQEFDAILESAVELQKSREESARVFEANKIEAARLAELERPDKERLIEWLDRIGQLVTDGLPQMSTEGGQEKLSELTSKLADTLDEMRGMLE